MPDEMDRQREIEERKFKKEVDALYGTTEVRVQLRKVIVRYTVNCKAKKGRPIGLDDCKDCEHHQGVSMDMKHVQCKVITQKGRSVVVTE